MTDNNSRRDCLMETISCGNDFTNTTSIHHHHHLHHAEDMNLENNSIQTLEYTTSYFLNSKPTDQMLVSTSAGVHMNKCHYSENKPSSTLMNVENSQHTVDSSVHSNISSSNTSTSVNTMNTGNEDADVTMCICPVCGFSASSPRRQDEHMELIHGEVVCNIMTSVTTNPILSVTTENSNSSPLMKSNKYDWPIEMNNSTFDLLQHPSQQTHLPLCNPLTLQASSTPQRNKLWSTDEQINSLLTITEQMQVNKKSDVVYNKIYTTTRTTDTTLNLKLSSPFTNIGTTTTTSVTNTNNSSTEIFNKLKTSQLTNDLKKPEKTSVYSPVKISKSNIQHSIKEKHKYLSSPSILSLSASSTSSSSLSSSPLSMTTTTTTTIAATPKTLNKSSLVGDDRCQPVAKKVDSRRRYRCNICPTTFPWHGDLTEHLRSVHGMQKSRENARNGKAGSFCCSHCKYVAKYQSELNRHMRLHWGVKPFICVFCPYRSAWKGDLKRHMESHHRERFTCETELIKIMSQFKNNAGTRTSSSSSSTGEHQSLLPITQFDMTMTESSEGDNTSDRYNCLQIDDDDDDDVENPLIISTVTTATTTTNNNNSSFNIDVENLDNSSNDYENTMNPITKSYTHEQSLKSTYEQNNVNIDNNITDNYNYHSNIINVTNTTQSNLIENYLPQTNLPISLSINNENHLICSICSYHAQNQSKFKNHMASHINLKQFKCPICGQRSNYKWDITKHMKKQHPYCSQLPITIINDKETIIDEHYVNMIKTSIPSTVYPSSSSSSSSSLLLSTPMMIPSQIKSSSCLPTHSSIVSFIPFTQQLTLFSQPQLTSQSTLIASSSLSSSSLSSISPKTNESLSLSKIHITTSSNEFNASNDPLNLIAYSSIKHLSSSPLSMHHSLLINDDDVSTMNDSLPMDLSTGYLHKNHKQDEIKNPVLLTNTLHSGSLSKCSLDDNHYPVYPLSSNELNNSIYSGVCLTSTTTTNATTTTMESKVNYPIVTYSLQKNTTNSFNNSNVSVISPYTIGSLISDPLKGNNTTTNPAINLLFNIQQQVLMSGLLQTWQQQQNQKYQELHQKDQTMHNNTCSGIVSYSDAVINMTSPSITKISSLCSPSSYATQTITPSTAIPNNTQYNTMFKPIGNHQLTGSPIVTTTQSPVDINLNTDVLKTNKINDTNSMNWVETQFTSEWSIPTNLDSINTVDKQSQSHRPHQQHQLQMNRFFAPGRRRESHRLVTRTNIGRKSAPMTTSLFNRHVNSPGTVSNTNNNTANCKEEQWKRFQCSGCGHRSNWKWDINKHIKVAHPERTNIVTITLDLEDAKNTYNEYMNRLKLSRNRYLSETIPDISTNSNSLTGTGLTGNTGEGYYRPFKCSVCGHRSNWKWDVGKHIKQIHNGNGEVQTLSLDEARRTIHQYKNRRRQHHRHSDLTIKCEPSFCSSSESNVNLSPVSLTVGEGNIDLPVSISSSSSSASCSSTSSSSTRMLNTNNDEVKNHDTTNNFHQINQYSLSSEYCPLNLSIDNSMISESFLELKKSPQTMITSQSSIPLNKYRLQLKFKCKFCTMKLNSWKSIIFHTYIKHYQQLLHHHHHHTSGNIDNHYLIKWLSLRRQIVHDVRYVNSNYHSCCYGNKMNQNIHLLNRKKFKCTEITCAQLDQFSIGKSIHSLQDNNNCDSNINDKQSNPSSLASSRSIATQRKLKEFTNFAHRNSLKCERILRKYQITHMKSNLSSNLLSTVNASDHHHHRQQQQQQQQHLSSPLRHHHHQSRPFRNLICSNQVNDSESTKINSLFNQSNNNRQRRKLTSGTIVQLANLLDEVLNLFKSQLNMNQSECRTNLMKHHQQPEDDKSETVKYNRNVLINQSEENKSHHHQQQQQDNDDDVITHLTDMIHETVSKNENLTYTDQLMLISMNSSTSSNEENQEIRSDKHIDESTCYDSISKIVKHPEIEKRFLHLANLLHHISHRNQ